MAGTPRPSSPISQAHAPSNSTSLEAFEQIKQYEGQLEEAERRLKDFKVRNLSAFGGGDALTALQALETQLSQAILYRAHG